FKSASPSTNTFKLLPALANARTANRFYFPANVAGDSYDLWTSDGTAAGTFSLQVGPGPSAAFINDDLATLNGLTYFSATINLTNSNQLFVTDGTTAGTRQISQLPVLDPIIPLETQHITEITPVGNYVYFSFSGKSGSTFYNELWRTDGTPSGTIMLDRITEVSSVYQRFTVDLNGIAYFQGRSNQRQALWRSDGAPGGTG